MMLYKKDAEIRDREGERVGSAGREKRRGTGKKK